MKELHLTIFLHLYYQQKATGDFVEKVCKLQKELANKTITLKLKNCEICHCNL